MNKSKKSPKGKTAESAKAEALSGAEAKEAPSEAKAANKAEPNKAEPDKGPYSLVPVVPANRLKDGPSKPWVGPYGRWSDLCFETVIDRLRLAANVRAVRLPMTSSATEDVILKHDAGEAPIAVVLSGVTIPAGLTEDIKIEPNMADDSVAKVTVYPPNKGIGVSVTLIFQTAGIGGTA